MNPREEALTYFSIRGHAAGQNTIFRILTSEHGIICAMFLSLLLLRIVPCIAVFSSFAVLFVKL